MGTQGDDDALVDNHVAALMEHFDAVHIFATKTVNHGRATSITVRGSGNWYARAGMIQTWLAQNDEGDRTDRRLQIETERRAEEE